MTFDWDPVKNLTNQQKHGVLFEEARTVFYDDNALLEYDALHSDSEDRFRLLGRSSAGNVLLVVHCIRNDDVIRIISCRHATSYETINYERRLLV